MAGHKNPSGLHNKVNKRIYEVPKSSLIVYYLKQYEQLKTMMRYLLECKFVPNVFFEDHTCETERKGLKRIWNAVFRTPYLDIRGFHERRAPLAYATVYQRWKRYIKERLVHYRSLFLVEAISYMMKNGQYIHHYDLKTNYAEINDYIDKNVWSQYWLQHYNEQHYIKAVNVEK